MPTRLQPTSARATSDREAAPAPRPSGLWTFVPLADYQLPTLPTASAAARTWASLKKLIAPNGDEGESPARQEDDLRALSEVQLEHLVAPIDWGAVASALDEALAERATAPSGGPGVVFVVGQPHCGHGETVEAWAARHAASVVDAPDPERILGGDPTWPGPWPAAGQRWALPRLERCFLRHDDGLALARRLLGRIASGEAGEGVIGCDSWAWAFLRRVWPLYGVTALTLQAFDAPRLSRLFSDLAVHHARRPLYFRNARTGRETLKVPQEDDAVGEETMQLAAHCRGNVGVAREYWRLRLRAEPESEAAPEGAGEASAAPREEVVWVSTTLAEPSLPTEADEDVALVLHAVLVHGGLSDSALPAVLPLAPHRCTTIARRLEHLGLLELGDGLWSVAPLAYALVRQWLSARDYLHDDF